MMNLDGMTDRQKQGVAVSNVPAIVTAGAGAGKTKVLTTKIANIIHQETTNVLAFSFTSKAANEIKERVIGMVGEQASMRVECRTFHSFALNFILKPYLNHEFLKPLGFKGKIDICINNYSYLREAFSSGVKPSVGKFLKSEGIKVDDFTQWLTLVRANASTVAEYAENLTDIPLEQLEHRANELEYDDRLHAYYLLMWRKYNSLLRAANQIDFDEVLLVSLQLLDHDPTVGKKLRERFGLVLVDEFQDTNITQYRMILHLINADASNLIIYGDIQQAIYAFRGGSSYIMAQFPDEFDNTQIINLPDNFRSTKAIVEVANIVSQQMKYRLSTENMISHKGTVEPVNIVGFPTPVEEAQWIVDKMLHLKGQGIAAPDICLLYRNKSHKNLIELELVKRKVKYVIVGDKGLFELEEVKAIVAFIHCLFHPTNIDALKKSLNTISLKLDSKRLGGYMSNCKRNNTTPTIHAILTKLKENSDSSPKIAEFANNIISVVMRLTTEIGNIKTFNDFLRACNIEFDNLSDDDKSDIRTKYSERIKTFYNDVCNAFIENIMCFHSQTVEQATQKADLEREQTEQFFSFIFSALLNSPVADIDILDYMQSLPLFSDRKSEKKNTDAIELMTVHKSKGLEKLAIFICGATQENWFKEIDESDADDKEEVLRLFYVACTRAIHYQYISHFDRKEVNNAWVEHSPIEYLNLDFGEHASRSVYSKGRVMSITDAKNIADYEQFEQTV
ncbi:ATP-dependent helicase [Photobacterium leiognathi]|uniref:ATP-dependent helicase n=1 Tax=Photobacterium leiognathi TaxID=553611 RepID=UPI002981C1BA|nr:ATP-dependent helicase [Photobacterium leiognathi]